MRKIISKIAGLMLGLSLAVGVGIAISTSKAHEVSASTGSDEIVYSSLGIGNQVSVDGTSYDLGSYFTVTVTKNSASTAPTYYTSGTAVRCYVTKSTSNGNIITVSRSSAGDAVSAYITKVYYNGTHSKKGTTSFTYSGSPSSSDTTTASYLESSQVTTASATLKETGGSSNGQFYLTGVKVEYVYTPSASTTYTVSFNSNGGSAVSPITDITSGTAISQPANPTKSNCTFAGWYTDSALTIAYNFSSEVTSSFTLYAKWELDLDTTGTSSDPYTVADARSAIDANLGLTDVYTSGIVYQVDSFNETYHSITYWISDDGTGSSSSNDGLEVYSGKGISGANFSSVDDIKVGDEVVVKGTLKKYNSTYEYDKNNELLSLTRKIAVNSLALSGTDISSNTMSIGSSDISAHTVTVTINSDATDKVVNIAHQSGSSIFTLSSASITCNSSGVGSFTVTGTEETSGSETFRVSSNSNPTVYQDLVVTALDDSVVYHVVSFNSNGGSASPANQNVEHGTTFTFPSPGTKEHHSFEGWSSDGGTTKYAVSATSPAVNDDVSYTAYWAEDAKYTITYTAGSNGSGSFADANVYAGSYILKAFDDLSGVSAAEGYRFKNYTVSGTDYAAGDAITISAATAVTVNFELIPDETTITTQVGTYASNNSWANSTQYLTMILDGYVTASVDGGGNSGKYYENDSSWRLYSSENATLTISVSGDKTLSSVTLTFTTADSPTVQFNSANITSGTAVEVSGTSAVFSVTSGKAHFTSISVTYVGSGSSVESFTITYNSNGGTGGSMTPTVGSNPEVEECGFIKEGYTFARWNTQADGEGDNYAVGASVSEDLTLYAIWQEYVAPIEGNVSMEGVTSASAVTVNGHPGLKCGAGSTAGAMKLVLSSATISKIKVYVAGWKGDSSKTINIEATGCTIAETSISISEDSAITGSSTAFTLDGSETTYKFIFEVSNATAGAEIALTAAQASKNRFVVWGATDLFAESFADEFNSNLTCDATGEDGPSFTSGHDWTTFNSFYNGLDAEEQGKLHDATFTVTGSGSSTVVTATGETAQSVAEAIAKYDYIIAKYGESNYTNFINRTIVPFASAPYVIPTINNGNSSTIIIVVVALTSITSIGVLLVIKRKRSLVK